VTTALLTFHACINYGSYWQARCLLEALVARGHDAVLLDHRCPRANRAEWRCALSPLAPAPMPRSDRAPYRRKVRRFFEAVEALPRSAPFPLDQPTGCGDFDLVVVGSDEVWNHPWYGARPVFFGEGLRTKQLVAYAGSFGNWSHAQGLHEGWADRLRAFHRISVRDDNSRRLVHRALGSEPTMVLDPCLQFPGHPSPGSSRDGRDVVVYGHTFSDWFARRARHWAGRRGLRLVSVGYRNDWADEQWLDAGPQDFADAIGGARAVLTNFFHGCVFAIRSGKSFLCEQSAYRSIKIRDLVADLACEAHVARQDRPAWAAEAVLDQPLAPAILARLAQRRRESAQYMDLSIPIRQSGRPGAGQRHATPR
jgi:hypothetical protein